MAEEDLKIKIKNWLNTQGYPLEMIVARAFRDAGFVTTPSEYFTDSKTQKMREIDVVARAFHVVEHFVLKLTFVIECKLAKKKPWLLFTTPNLSLRGRSVVEQRAASMIGNEFLQKISSREDVQKLPIFNVPNTTAYGIADVRFNDGGDDEEGNNVSYIAAAKASDAAIAQLRLADQGTEQVGPVCEIVFPVIVAGNRLFECYLDEKSETVVSEVSSGLLVWHSESLAKPMSIITIITQSEVEKFAREAAAACKVIYDSCRPEIDELAERWKSYMKQGFVPGVDDEGEKDEMFT